MNRIFRGQGLVEYALTLIAAAVVVILIVAILGPSFLKAIHPQMEPTATVMPFNDAVKATVDAIHTAKAPPPTVTLTPKPYTEEQVHYAVEQTLVAETAVSPQ